MERLASLEALGVERVCTVIGKGHTGVILAGLYRGSIVAVKVRRLDSRRGSLEGEAARLARASRHGASPRPHAWDRNAIVMDLVEGPLLGEALHRDPLRAVEASLDAARALDTAGILHHEIHRPWRNVVFTGSHLRAAVVIDLDSAGEGCGNASRIVSGLASRLPALRGESVVEALRAYKRSCSRRAYEDLKKAVLEAAGRGLSLA